MTTYTLSCENRWSKIPGFPLKNQTREAVIEYAASKRDEFWSEEQGMDRETALDAAIEILADDGVSVTEV